MERTSYYLIAGMIAGCTVAPAMAQDSYLFEADQSGTHLYMDIEGATPVQTFDAEGWHLLPATAMGTPWLFGVTPTAGPGGYVAIANNGRVRFGNDYGYTEVSIANALMDPIDASSGVSYNMSNDAVLVQYKDMHLFYGLNGNYMNVQMRLEPATGLIEFYYGPRSESNGSGFAGNRGPKTGVARIDADGGDCLERIWLTGSPDGPQVDYVASNNFPGLSGLPMDGTVFSFIPLFVIPEGISEQAASPFRMMSTLVQDQLVVNVDRPNGSPYSITDSAGRTVIQDRLNGGSNSIAVYHLPTGMYALTCSSDGQMYTARFVKE